MSCPFCELENDAYRIVHQTPLTVVMLNLTQVGTGGQLLVLPRRHVREIMDLNAEEALEFNLAVQMCMDLFEYSEEYDSPMYFLQGWKHRSQEHLHGHVMPSKRSWLELMLSLWQDGTVKPGRASPEELEATRDHLLEGMRSALTRP